MKIHRLLPVVLLFCCTCSLAGENIPDWLARQLPDRTVLAKPGVYPLADGKLLGVGQGTVHESLRDSQALRMALNAAERDAKQRVARHLYPDLFASHKSVAVEARHILRVFEQPPNTAGGKAFVAIVVDAVDVSAKPMFDASTILGAEKVVLPSEMLLYADTIFT